MEALLTSSRVVVCSSSMVDHQGKRLDSSWYIIMPAAHTSASTP